MSKNKRKPKPPENEFTFEIVEAREAAPSEVGLILTAGPPGSGKSTLLGQMCEEGPTLLLCMLRREASSWKYQEYNPDVIYLEDPQWKPEPPDEDSGEPRGEYIADAFMKFLHVVDALVTDEIVSESGKPYRVILIDSGTELGEAAWRESLKPFGVMDPAYIDGDKFGPYTALTGHMKRAMTAIQALKGAPTPKFVGISWHVQPTKEDQEVKKGGGEKVVKVSADNRAEGAEYEGDFLPRLRGAYRRAVFGEVDAVVWTHIEHEAKRLSKEERAAAREAGLPTTGETTPRYMLQVRTDEERHCKVPGPLPKVKYIDNSWEELKKLMVVKKAKG